MRTLHKVISASAGSGKTFQLTNRYIYLLSCGVRPEEIVALTFSRKAAAEIFARIVQRLAGAAKDPEKCQELSRFIEEQGGKKITEKRAIGLLRDLLYSMPNLEIGTLDSFFARIIRAFPLELGLRGEFGILDGPGTTMFREQSLRRMLSSRNKESRTLLIEEFRRANFEADLKTVYTVFHEHIREKQSTYLEVPDPARWGNQHAVWPNGNEWLNGEFSLDENEREQFLERHPDPKWREAVAQLQAYLPGPGGNIKTLAKRVLEKAVAIRDGANVEIKNGRRVETLNAEDHKFLTALLGHVVQQHLNQKLSMTAGYYGLLHLFEQEYHQAVRQTGRLTFEDMLLVLNRTVPLTGEPDGDDERLYIDYRLDGQFNHWLLDEFQDTNIAQWNVLRNLIEEVVQAQSPERTFFYVGDVKQAIYGWRGGYAELFDLVANQYAKAGLERDTLACSWRSSSPVIDTVNAVFEAVLKSDKINDQVRTRWQAAWAKHQVAERKNPLPGCAALYQIPRGGNAGRFNKDSCLQAAVGVIQEIQAQRAGSIGVLVRSNKTGLDLLPLLREAGIKASWEGARKIKDAPATATFLSFVKYAAHPADRYAKEHVMMSPLAERMQERGYSIQELPAVAAETVYNHGYEALIREWLPEAEPALLEAARVFDASLDRNADHFIDWIQNIEVQTDKSEHDVTVMTIHKAKGLEFDHVILPELFDSQRGMDKARFGLEVHHTESLSPEWVLEFPSKHICQADDVLQSHADERNSRAAYEGLCLLYVAMTRAAYGLYMITPEPAAKSTSLQMSTLLDAALSGDQVPVDLGGVECNRVYTAGTLDWQVPSTGIVEPATVAASVQLPEAEPRARLERRRVSEEGGGGESYQLFRCNGQRAVATGLALHELYESIEWLDGVNPQECFDVWMKKSGAVYQRTADLQKIKTLFMESIAAPDIQNLLTKPAQPVDLWREQPFEIVYEGQWVSGRFDRVVLYRDEKGAVQNVQLVDYKSGQADPKQALEHHRPQMQMYRTALAGLTGLHESRIEIHIVFLAHGVVLPLYVLNPQHRNRDCL